jgi:hypothetical protein
MNKEDILKKSREENVFMDERQQQVFANSFGFGGVMVGFFCLLFCIIKAIQDQRFDELVVILFGYLAGTSWRTYIVTKKKLFMIQAIAYSLTAVLGLFGYFAWV